MPKKNGQQTQIPGTERKVHKDVRDAAETYREVRDERMELTEREVEAKADLMAAMKKHGLQKYVDEDAEIEAEIVPGEETVKVRKWKAPKDKPANVSSESAEA